VGRVKVLKGSPADCRSSGEQFQRPSLAQRTESRFWIVVRGGTSGSDGHCRCELKCGGGRGGRGGGVISKQEEHGETIGERR